MARCLRVRSQKVAVLLVAAGKTGMSQKQFYKALIDKADDRFGRHIEQLKELQKKNMADQAKKHVGKGEKK